MQHRSFRKNLAGIKIQFIKGVCSFINFFSPGIGPRGCGKSVIVERLAGILGYTPEPIMLYQDMTARDLLQQRTTLPNGDTVWRRSPLVEAAIQGKMAILDGVHRYVI